MLPIGGKLLAGNRCIVRCMSCDLIVTDENARHWENVSDKTMWVSCVQQDALISSVPLTEKTYSFYYFQDQWNDLPAGTGGAAANDYCHY